MRGGRCVLVTGISRGLGRAMVEQLAAAGHRVLGCCRTERAVLDLRSELGGGHSFRVVDVADSKEVERFADELDAAGAVPDLLINNAALINANAKLHEVPADEFRRVIDVNVTGSFHVIRAFLPRMLERGRGVIVNFSSGWGRSTSPDVAPYCASKWAIEGLTAALAQELPAPLAAVALNPGVIDTPMLRSCFGAASASHRRPETWAETAVPYLLSLGRRDNGRALTAP